MNSTQILISFEVILKNGLQTPELSFNKVLIRSACHNLNGSCKKCTEISAAGNGMWLFGTSLTAKCWSFDGMNLKALMLTETLRLSIQTLNLHLKNLGLSMGKWLAQNHVARRSPDWWASALPAAPHCLPFPPICSSVILLNCIAHQLRNKVNSTCAN